MISLYVRSLCFSAGMIISTLVIGPLVLLAIVLPFEYRYGLTKLWTRFNIWWLKFTCNIHYNIQGKDNIPLGSTIVLAKHQSTWETLFLHYYLPPLTWVIKRELLKLPLFGWCLGLLQPIAIDRSSASEAVQQILSQGKRYLDQGRWVLIFPEGTRTSPGEKKRYRLGGARLAAHTGYPILPVAHNAGEHWPRKGFLKRPGTIRVVFGPLIESANQTPEQINTAVEQWIEKTVANISSEKCADASINAKPAS